MYHPLPARLPVGYAQAATRPTECVDDDIDQAEVGADRCIVPFMAEPVSAPAPRLMLALPHPGNFVLVMAIGIISAGFGTLLLVLPGGV